MKKINFKSLAVFVAISLGTGILATLFSRPRADFYGSINQPAVTPPSWLFPIVWTILYILMGVSAYLIYETSCRDRRLSLGVWAFQLAVNFIWTLVFFNARAFLFAFILIIVLWIMIAVMIALFHRCRPTAAYLQVPYFLWVTFAAYLTWSIYMLN
ncbi:MAG: tryptophan-rich sensory protein [Clostridia bacterium]|nr:tryptophan-rich sensory protein [Clostridia bacterium]